jgi:sec-independent protein translocase protein TatB
VFNLGMGEITVILLLALIFLGPRKLPDLAAGLGKLIKEVRKATSDVKNEIALDDSFRKPFEELRDAVTLHPDELKRRDEWKKQQEEMTKRAAEEAAQLAAEGQTGQPGDQAPEGPPEGYSAESPAPADGLLSPFTTMGISHPTPEELAAAGSKPTIMPEVKPGPNDTIVQAVPRGATLEDIPTPPPEPVAAKPAGMPTGKPPAGTIAARKPTPPALPTLAPKAPAAPANGETPGVNTTQIIKEEDLIPMASSGKPPPPPHLPGLRPAGAPRPPGIVPPLPPNPLDKKNKP